MAGRMDGPASDQRQWLYKLPVALREEYSDGCHKTLEVGKHYSKLSGEYEKICFVDITLYVVFFGLNVKKNTPTVIALHELSDFLENFTSKFLHNGLLKGNKHKRPILYT
jgi:hypothetical protein